MNTNRVWMGAAALIAIVTVLGGWFIGISPKIGEITSSNTRIAETQALNDVHAAELAALEKQYAELDATTAALEELRRALPPGADFPAFLRTIQDAATASGVALTDFTLAEVVRYSPSAAAPGAETAPEAPAEGEEAPDAEAETPAADSSLAAPATGAASTPVTSPLVTPENMIVVPMTIKADGSYEALRLFVGALQSSTRLFLVTSLNAVAEPAGAPAKGAAAAASTYAGTITGNVYVLFDPTIEVADAAAPEAPAADQPALEGEPAE
jgi:Tfp pilus assembly protein PilO